MQPNQKMWKRKEGKDELLGFMMKFSIQTLLFKSDRP